MNNVPPLALIVEDDEMMATFFVTAFRDAGYVTKSIHDGQEAIDFLEEATPAILLLDLQLPHVSGEAILEFIKEQPHLKDLSIFVASVEGTRSSYLQDQVDLVLTKPVNYQQLRSLALRMFPSDKD